MFKVIYQDKNIVVINKPAGLLVHSTHQRESTDTLADELVVSFPEIKGVGDSSVRPGIVHRLDKDTSGVLVIARNQSTFDYLKKLFQTHKIKKTYLALVWGRLQKTGMIDKPIGLKSGTTKRSTTSKKMKMVKDAITRYEVIKNIGDFSLVRVFPETGRTHQIRVHFMSIGHSIVGDQLYGRKDNPWGLKRQFLHSESIELNLEDGKRVKFEADLPEELKAIIINSND